MIPDPLSHGDRRVVIEQVQPSVDDGSFPARVVAGDRVVVTANIFADGHDLPAARLLFRPLGETTWNEIPMEAHPNDEWSGVFKPDGIGIYEFDIIAWIDPFLSWRHGFRKKMEDSQPLPVEIEIGTALVREMAERAVEPDREEIARLAGHLASADVPQGEKVHLLLSDELDEYQRRYPDLRRATSLPFPRHLFVERKRAACSAWYEFFPRSFGSRPGEHGTFDEAQEVLPRIAAMGFNIVYLPPIHPIGRAHRKGPNNSLVCGPDDIGSPWAIGSEEGGHKAVHPELGTLDSFQAFVWKAGELGLEVALDIAFQCSPDHPYVREHPEWFRWRPDGTVQYAENPPKKYQDILPFDFENPDWRALWEELLSIFLFWIDKGVTIFRVDNPHTKPLEFWRWLIREIKIRHPEVILLSEAFTRPKLKYRLGKAGFTQGYTYFTWRNTKEEITTYLEELCSDRLAHSFWPNFWPNTPDILPQVLQFGGRAAFIHRAVLAATLSSNWGIYGPAFELCVSQAVPGKEEYHDSEKYELKDWEWEAPGNIRSVVRKLNQIRRDHPALQRTFNLRFVPVDNPQLIAYIKTAPGLLNIILVVVNLDPVNAQSGWLVLPLDALGIDEHSQYLVQDLLPDSHSGMPGVNYLWSGARNYVELNPAKLPAHIFRVFRKQKREQDFDYWL